MEQGLIDLILFRIHEKFMCEEDFYERLNLTQKQWEKWKCGQHSLSQLEVSAMIHLFSDYEWMLVQKVIRAGQVLVEKESTALLEFTKMRGAIAKKWLQADMATVELVEQVRDENILEKNIEVRVTMNYGVWGYADLLSFTFPAKKRDMVTGTTRQLIQLMDESLGYVNV